MRTTQYTLALSLLLAGMASCNNEEVATIDVREPVMLSAGVVTSVVSEESSSRGTTPAATVSPFANRTFKLIITDKRTGANNSISQNVTTGNAEIGTTTPVAIVFAPTLYWDDYGGIAGNLSFIGVYPNNLADGIFTVGTQTSTINGTANANDIMLACHDAYLYTDRATPANLPFEHKMAKVTLNINGGGGGQVSLNDITKVTLNNFGTQVIVDINQKTVISNSTIANIIPYLEKTLTTSTRVTYTAIVAPSTIAGKTRIATITTQNGKIYTATLPEKTGSCSLKAGVNNIFNVTLTKPTTRTTNGALIGSPVTIPAGTTFQYLYWDLSCIDNTKCPLSVEYIQPQTVHHKLDGELCFH